MRRDCCQWLVKSNDENSTNKCMISGVRYKCNGRCTSLLPHQCHKTTRLDLQHGATIAPFSTTKIRTDLQRCDSSHLSLITISKFEYNNETLIELLGPAKTKHSAAAILSAPHGGTLRPDYIPNRQTKDTSYCNPKKPCLTLNDSFTKDIALSIAHKIVRNYCKAPFVVINHLHRTKLDANRNRLEGAQDNEIADEAWKNYHTFIQDAQRMIMDEHGIVDNDIGQSGIKGLLLDVHGYAGYDWKPTHVQNYEILLHENIFINQDGIRFGSPFIQWGYGLSKESLDNTDLDVAISDVTKSTMIHAMFLPNLTLESLIRGPKSIGSRLASSMKNDPTWNKQKDSKKMCGMGLPSYDFPNPNDLTHKTSFCNDLPCRYFSGGYNVNSHKYYYDWETRTNSTLIMNTIQMELPRCIRFGDSDNRSDIDFETRNAIHDRFSHHLSASLCSFISDLFQDQTLC